MVSEKADGLKRIDLRRTKKVMNPESDEPTVAPTDEHTKGEEVSLRRVIWQAAAVTVGLVIVVYGLAQFFKEPTQELARWVLSELGLPGIFLGVIAADGFTFPVPPDTYLLVAVAGEGNAPLVLITCMVASVVAASIAYVVGPQMVRVPLIRARIERFRPRGIALYKKYGMWTVTIAALSPLPFSIVCWFARIYEMPYGRFFLATTARIPRFVIYYYVIRFGWGV